VLFVDANAAKVEHGQARGVSIEGLASVAARFSTFDDWAPGEHELVLLCTKCYDNARVLERIPHTATVVPIQNGFDARLQSRCAHECIASFVSQCDSDRPHSRITRTGALHVGPCGSGEPMSGRLSTLVTLLQAAAAFPLVQVENILPFKHSKLMYNAAISPLAAISGMDNGQLLTQRRVRQLFFAFLRENYAILNRAGIPLATIGPFHPRTVNRILRTPLLGTIMAGPFSKSLNGTYCSMSGDIETGRTEVDNFNGHLIRLAGDGPCPLNMAAVELVDRMAAGQATPAPHYLDELLA
jgi:2-dehydropantoate 2-reductase